MLFKSFWSNVQAQKSPNASFDHLARLRSIVRVWVDQYLYEAGILLQDGCPQEADTEAETNMKEIGEILMVDICSGQEGNKTRKRAELGSDEVIARPQPV